MRIDSASGFFNVRSHKAHFVIWCDLGFTLKERKRRCKKAQNCQDPMVILVPRLRCRGRCWCSDFFSLLSLNKLWQRKYQQGINVPCTVSPVFMMQDDQCFARRSASLRARQLAIGKHDKWSSAWVTFSHNALPGHSGSREVWKILDVALFRCWCFIKSIHLAVSCILLQELALDTTSPVTWSADLSSRASSRAILIRIGYRTHTYEGSLNYHKGHRIRLVWVL